MSFESLTGKKILLMTTGSIAAFKVASLVSALKKRNCEIQVVASPSALQFVGAATWEGLTGRAVYSDLWEQGRMMDHIAVNRWADVVMVAPATAHFMNAAASGALDGIVGSVFLAHDFTKPFLIAPAMNQAMFAQPATQKAMQLLAERGFTVLPAGQGDLACGEQGDGRLLEVEDLLSALQRALDPRAIFFKGRILITAGGTSEAIDDVRVITNKSTGATAAALAQKFLSAGYQVTYVHAKSAVVPTVPAYQRSAWSQKSFENFSELQSVLQTELKNNHQVVFHAAAVSDFSVKRLIGKISSAGGPPQLEWIKNPKLIDTMKEWAGLPKPLLVGFKLTSTKNPDQQIQAVQKLRKSSQADWVIQNDAGDLQDRSQTPYQIFSESDQVEKLQGTEALTQYLLESIQRRFSK